MPYLRAALLRKKAEQKQEEEVLSKPPVIIVEEAEEVEEEPENPELISTLLNAIDQKVVGPAEPEEVIAPVHVPENVDDGNNIPEIQEEKSLEPTGSLEEVIAEVSEESEGEITQPEPEQEISQPEVITEETQKTSQVEAEQEHEAISEEINAEAQEVPEVTSPEPEQEQEQETSQEEPEISPELSEQTQENSETEPERQEQEETLQAENEAVEAPTTGEFDENSLIDSDDNSGVTTLELEPEPEEPTSEPEPEETEPTPDEEPEADEFKLQYDFTSGERYVDKVSTKTDFDKMLDELGAISKDLLDWQVEKFAKQYTGKFQGEGDNSEAEAKKFEAFLGGYITNAAMILDDKGYRDQAIKQLEQAKSILEARKRLEEERQAIIARVEEQNDAVDLSDILGLFGDA